MTNVYKNIESRIGNTLGLTEVCRGEWCRELESEVDLLDAELRSYCIPQRSCSSEEVTRLEANLNRSFENLPPDFTSKKKSSTVREATRLGCLYLYAIRSFPVPLPGFSTVST